jgi:hypothetical protein
MDLHRSGRDPVAIKSNVSILDVTSMVRSGHLDNTLRFINECSKDIKEAKRLMTIFWNIVEDTVPLFESDNIGGSGSNIIPADEKQIQQDVPQFVEGHIDAGSAISDNLFDSTIPRNIKDVQCHNTVLRVLYPNSLTTDGISNENFADERPFTPLSSVFNEDDPNSEFSRQHIHSKKLLCLRDLSAELSQTLVGNYSRMKNIQNCLIASTTVVDTTLQGLHSACVDLEATLGKVKFAAALASGYCPTYCGWVRKSSGFSLIRLDKTFSSSHGQKMWATLVQNNLYFMQQPYSKTVSLTGYPLNLYLPSNFATLCRLIMKLFLMESRSLYQIQILMIIILEHQLLKLRFPL